jgi:hypothetical protein
MSSATPALLRTPMLWPSVYNSRRNSKDTVEMVSRRLALLGTHPSMAVDPATDKNDDMPTWIARVGKELQGDIAVLMRERAKEGYSMNACHLCCIELY